MQIVAEMWLVLTLTGSGFAVGLTAALQFLPMLVAGAWGGLVADSMPKRRLLLVTQALMALPALALFALTVAGDVAAWMVMALVLARGFVLAVDMPARQSFVIEIVGPDRVVNAVGLQSVLIHSSRITGPAHGGTADRRRRHRALLPAERPLVRRDDPRAALAGHRAARAAEARHARAGARSAPPFAT